MRDSIIVRTNKNLTDKEVRKEIKKTKLDHGQFMHSIEVLVRELLLVIIAGVTRGVTPSDLCNILDSEIVR